MMGLLLSLIIAVAAFNIITSLGLLVMEKQGEVAILQTRGLTRRQIMSVFMVQRRQRRDHRIAAGGSAGSPAGQPAEYPAAGVGRYARRRHAAGRYSRRSGGDHCAGGHAALPAVNDLSFMARRRRSSCRGITL